MSEHQEQKALIQWCDTKGHPYNLIFAIPNVGNRSVQFKVYLKAEGLRPGIPDLFLPVPSGKYHGLFVEMKSKGGSTNANQEQWLSKLLMQGYMCEVCYGWDQAKDILIGYCDDR